MVHVPGEMPVTTPEVIPTVATDGVLLLQVPPEVESVNALVEPTQTLAVPLMGPTGVAPDTCTE